MAGDIYPRFRATAVQAAPVFLDREATISRLADWVAKARDVGADLVVFGESFIPPQRPIDLIHRHERRGHAGRALEEPAAVEALLAAESIRHGEMSSAPCKLCENQLMCNNFASSRPYEIVVDRIVIGNWSDL